MKPVAKTTLFKKNETVLVDFFLHVKSHLPTTEKLPCIDNNGTDMQPFHS